MSLKKDRWSILISLKNILSPLMDVLSFIWLILTIVELTKGLSEFLGNVVTLIWIIFLMHFLTEFLIAPSKKTYIKHNFLTAISLALPALRIFRFLRIIRGMTLVKTFSAINRGMKSLRKSLATRILAYIISLTIIVVASSAAGILYLEKDYTDYFTGYGTALWWSGMMVTTMGPDYFPKSPEGRILAFVLAVYGFAIFGYVTASVATFFLKTPTSKSELDEIRDEINKLKKVIKSGPRT